MAVVVAAAVVVVAAAAVVVVAVVAPVTVLAAIQPAIFVVGVGRPTDVTVLIAVAGITTAVALVI